MSSDDLQVVMARDLRALAREVSLYPSDEQLWRVVPGIANSGGTLARHLAGNIQHFVGAVLGGSGYVRDREAEFGKHDLTRSQLVTEAERALAELDRVMPTLDAARLAAEFPVELLGRRLVTARALTHFASHFAYHLGQVDYHRRVVAPESGTAGTMSLTEI